MTLKVNKKDNTRNQRQARRREREKQWLKENGWRSWEALHTALMNGTARLISCAGEWRQRIAFSEADKRMGTDVVCAGGGTRKIDR